LKFRWSETIPGNVTFVKAIDLSQNHLSEGRDVDRFDHRAGGIGNRDLGLRDSPPDEFTDDFGLCIPVSQAE
jgi:hypothetical protein